MSQSAKNIKNNIIMPPVDKAPIHTGNILAWIWYFLTPYKKSIIAYSIYRFIRDSYFAMLPLVIGFMINALNSGIAQENANLFFGGALAYMLLFAVFAYNMVFVPEVRNYEKAVRALTLYSINHLNKLSIDWHEKQGSGGKLQRVMTARVGLQELSRFYRWDFFNIVGQITAITVSVIFMDIPGFYIFLYIGFIGSFLTASYYFARPYLWLFNKYQETFEGLLSGVYEFVSSIRTVKSYSLSPYIYKRARDLEQQGQGAIIDAFAQNLKRWTICNLIAVVWITIFLILGLYLVLNDQLSTGAYATSFFLASNVWGVCIYFGAFLEKLFEHGNAIHRLVKTLRIQPKKFDLQPAQQLLPDWEAITIDNLCYTYDEEGNHGIKNLNIHAKRGQKIALVGNSGAGKSTFIKLLMKQMLPEQGSINIDNSNISYIATADWLSQISYVPQDIELFNLSIRDNILLDKQDIDPGTLDHVLKQSALAEFIETLPEGLDTMVGERGVKLSGGQRQRLGIARALVRQAPIIIFDEATSALDSISERQIQKAIENSFEGRTAFIIAHRLSTIRNADHIIVLDEGEIIEQGDFDTLITLNAHFAKLWNMQSR